MIVPEPPFELERHCSVIHENTLYTFSPNGFASIPLRRNGTWTELKKGVPVSGAACVRAGINGHQQEEALYVIGGTGSPDDNFTGFQRYSFQKEEWETLRTPDPQVARNRTRHGAAYLKSSSSILLYAGDQKGSTTPSAETYVIDTAAPYTVSSAERVDKASPANFPVLLPWNNRDVALVGGTRDGERIHIFKSVDRVWTDSEVTLAHAPPDDVKYALLNRPDGSKVLENFNMNASPNTVTSIALLNAGGKPARPGQIVGGPSRKRKRDGAFNNFPPYGGQFASKTTRKDYSLAQGDNGLVVISSGRGTDSLAIFNQTSNSWLNSTKLFYGDQSKQEILGPTTTSTSPPTSSSTESSAPAGSGSSDSNVGTIVGATLGSVLGVAAILILILLFLRREKTKRGAQGKDGSNDKDRLSFQDQGIEPLAQSAYPMAKSPVPMANSSVDSLAIFSGKAGEKSAEALGPSAAYGPRSYQPTHSPLSTIQSSGNVTPANDKAFEAAAVGSHPGDRRTDEGWSKYFEDNNSATNLARMQSERSVRHSDRSVNSSELGNPGPKENAWPMQTLTPLNFGFLDSPTPLGQVVSGSPTTEHSPSGRDGRSLVIPEGQSARISSADSISLHSDDNDRRDTNYFSSNDINDEAHLPRAAQRSWLGRPPSSTYSSMYQPSARATMTSNGRRSSVIIPEGLDGRPVQHHANSDMSWLNLNADR